MFELRITNESEVKDVYFEATNPSHQPEKIEKNGGEKTVELNSGSRMEFVFYSGGSQNTKKPATYTYFKINHPGDHVTIDIDKVSNSHELKTVIEWPKNVKPGDPAENVEVGVKE